MARLSGLVAGLADFDQLLVFGRSRNVTAPVPQSTSQAPVLPGFADRSIPSVLTV